MIPSTGRLNRQAGQLSPLSASKVSLDRFFAAFEAALVAKAGK